MKNITSTFGIVLAAGLTIGAIAAVSIAEGQMYTKGGVVQNAQTQVSSSAVTSNAGSVTTVNVVEQPTPAPTSSGNAAVALGPAAATSATANATTVSASQPAVAPANGQCAGGRQALSFDSPTVSFRGVTYSFTPTPPISIAGGAAIAAIYPAANGQSEICYSGECIGGPAGSCGAIAFAQPGGRVRIYVQ